MADRWTVFEAGIRHALQCWPALGIAQQQGFGGNNVSEKLEWLFDVLVQIFRDNDHVYPDELEDYLSECLYNEFDMIVEDGTLPNLVEKICRYNNCCCAGKLSEVMEELRVPPPNMPAVMHQLDENDIDDPTTPGGHHPNTNGETSILDAKQSPVSSVLRNDTSNMEIEDEPMETENNEADDGWEVVKRSKKKQNVKKV